MIDAANKGGVLREGLRASVQPDTLRVVEVGAWLLGTELYPHLRTSNIFALLGRNDSPEWICWPDGAKWCDVALASTALVNRPRDLN